MVQNREEMLEAMVAIGKIYTKYGLSFGEIDFITEKIKEATIEWYKKEYTKRNLLLELEK
jgi:hypothetical protein